MEELLKYGGLYGLLEHLFRIMWQKEVVPKEWREGLIVKKGNR